MCLLKRFVVVLRTKICVRNHDCRDLIINKKPLLI